jgi:hypothetical protein
VRPTTTIERANTDLSNVAQLDTRQLPAVIESASTKQLQLHRRGNHESLKRTGAERGLADLGDAGKEGHVPQRGTRDERRRANRQRSSTTTTITTELQTDKSRTAEERLPAECR